VSSYIRTYVRNYENPHGFVGWYLDTYVRNCEGSQEDTMIHRYQTLTLPEVKHPRQNAPDGWDSLER